MKRLNNICDPDWLIRIVASYLFHVYKCNSIGFILDYTPDVPNTIFILAMSILLLQYQLLPKSLKRPPVPIFLLLEALLSVFWTNILRSLVWIPFEFTLKDNLRVLSKQIVYVNHKLGYGKRSTLRSLARWLTTESCFSRLSLMVAIGIFVWVLHATDILELIKRILKPYVSCYGERLKPKSYIYTSRALMAPLVHHPSPPPPPPRPRRVLHTRGTVSNIIQNLRALISRDVEQRVECEQEELQFLMNNNFIPINSETLSTSTCS